MAKSFEELEVWQNARKLVKDIYKTSSTGAFSKDFALRDQIRRAAISISSNIAEGFERSGNKEFIHFLYIAKGSASEVRAQLYLILDLSLLPDPDFNRLNASAISISRQLAALIRYLERSDKPKRTAPQNL